MAHSSSSLSFPADVLHLRGDPFFNFVRQRCGEIVVEVLQMQAIYSVHSLLSMDDHFSFFELNSDDLIALRRKVGMTLTDGSFKVKPGVRLQLENLVRSLRELFPADQHRSSAADLVIPAALLNDYAFLRPLIDFCQNGFQNFDASSDSNMKLLPFFLQTLLTNIAQSDSRNRYSDELKSFALCLYIFAGHNVYEFVRLNIPGALPNSTSIKTYLASSDERLSEGAYRYDVMARHMSLMNSKFAFCAEDYTAVVRRIHYNSHTNTFVGFVPDFRDGFPVETGYSTESFDELQSWYAERDMSALLSVNVIQPLLVNSSSSASYILSAYGTNANYTALDILRRWIEIVDQSSKRNIRVVGFSSDCDPKFLKAMRLALGFFAHVPNISIDKYPNTFAVDVPTEWGWFFLRGRQFFVCMQDSVHLCTKLRNRLLSPKVTLLLGRQRVSVQYLYELIKNSSKLNHRLVRSDISPKDRQNYDSCEKISSDDVLRELEQIPNSEATLLYLKMIRAVRLAYIEKSTNFVERVYFAWLSVFVFRRWYVWIDRTYSSSKNDQFFITRPCYLSVEINAHTLVYLALLVIQGLAKEEVLRIYDFNSQTCENTFRIARSMSGTFSSSIRCDTNTQGLSGVHLSFPRHHKQQGNLSSPAIASHNGLSEALLIDTVLRAFNDATQLFSSFHPSDFRNTLSIEELSCHIRAKLNRSRIVETSSQSEAQPEEEDDEGENEQEQEAIEGDGGNEAVDDDTTLDTLSNISKKTFKGMRIYDSIDSSKARSFFIIKIDGEEKFIHKQAAIWLLQEEKFFLSADRLQRVKM